MRSSSMKYSGSTAVSDSEEMSVKRLVSPRNTTLRLTVLHGLRPTGCDGAMAPGRPGSRGNGYMRRDDTGSLEGSAVGLDPEQGPGIVPELRPNRRVTRVSDYVRPPRNRSMLRPSSLANSPRLR